jgi:hypothetical protein
MLKFAEAHADKIGQMRYENLVTDPAGALAELGAYLGWEGLERVVDKSLVRSVGGSLGDPTGTSQYGSISRHGLEAWKSKIDNWYRRAWANRYFSGARAEKLRALGYEWPEELASRPWWRDGLWSGVVEWARIRRRLHRSSRHPRWPARFAKRFRREHGYDVIFR